MSAAPFEDYEHGVASSSTSKRWSLTLYYSEEHELAGWLEEQGATDYEDWHKVRCCLQRGEDHAFTDSQLLYYFIGEDPDRSKSLTKALRFQIT